MVPVGVADQVVKDGRVDDVEQARARVVRGRFLHGVAVALVILPPAAREEPSSPSGNHHCTATAATAALSHLRVHQERRAAQARQRRKSLTTVFHEKSKLCINIPAYGASCSFSSKIHQNQLPMESRVRVCILPTPQWPGYVMGRSLPCHQLPKNTSVLCLFPLPGAVSSWLSSHPLPFFFLLQTSSLWLAMSPSAPRRRASQCSLSFTPSCFFPDHFLCKVSHLLPH